MIIMWDKDLLESLGVPVARRYTSAALVRRAEQVGVSPYSGIVWVDSSPSTKIKDPTGEGKGPLPDVEFPQGKPKGTQPPTDDPIIIPPNLPQPE